ncbi:MAG: hypothetical protein WC683_01035 [bacterium]
MRLIHVWVSDEFYGWLEPMLGHDLALDGMGFQVGEVDRDDRGELSCKAIFQAAQQREGGPEIERTIKQQDAAFAERSRT